MIRLTPDQLEVLRLLDKPRAEIHSARYGGGDLVLESGDLRPVTGTTLRRLRKVGFIELTVVTAEQSRIFTITATGRKHLALVRMHSRIYAAFERGEALRGLRG